MPVPDAIILGGISLSLTANLIALSLVIRALRRSSAACSTGPSHERAAFDRSPVALLVRERHGPVKAWNRAAEKLYGWPRGKIVGMNACSILETKFAVEWPQVEAMLDAHGHWTGHVEQKHMSGHSITTLVQWTLVRGQPGCPDMIVEANIELTGDAAAIFGRLSEERYRTIFDTLAVGVWEHDFRAVKQELDRLHSAGVVDIRKYIKENPDFVTRMRRTVTISNPNDAALGLFDVASRTDFFKKLSDFLPEDDGSFEECIVAIDDGEEKFVCETEFRNPDGEAIAAIVALSFPPGTGYDRVTGSVLDIGDRRRMEAMIAKTRAELEQALRAASLGELSATIAHEVNQPLAAVINFARAAQCWVCSPVPDLMETRAALTDVIEAAQNAADVVRRVRTLLGKAKPEYAPVPVDQVIGTAVLLAQRDADTRGITIVQELQAPGSLILGDRILLQQVVANLLGNAMQAIDAFNPPSRRVTLGTSADDEHVRLAVRDTGGGFSPEDFERAFETFYTTRSEGMGLGLSICRSIVEALDGTIEIANRSECAGAAITIVLPRTRADGRFRSHGRRLDACLRRDHLLRRTQ
ncbi:PAS domain S-box protein [Gluconacetobacter azotocaptans]|uniref:PAS domain-containing sensor histidine kinase n=1 Tax=Gluconacetobacter azotocaptans TaxID=142834 RepID=UPI00195AE293|nr:ATP-binding protein [Gluconacetobacter azotocaptans]MBM9401141.1 PAS domain S-box protein [Gluconacetobacter azotocaptans]